MAREIKTILALDGETKFKNAISGINKDMSVLSSELKNATSGMSKTSDAQKIAAATAESLKQKIDLQNKKIGETRNALSQAASAYGEADNRTKEYRIQLNNAESALKQMEAELKDNEAAAKSTGIAMKESGANVSSMSEHFSNASSGALSFGDVLKANVIGSVITDGIRAVASGIKDMASSVMSNSDELEKMAAKTGLSTERLQELQYIGDDLGVDLDTMASAQDKLTKSMNAAKTGTGSQSDAFKALGISVTDASGNLRDAKTVMNEAYGALGSVANETERDALAMSIFGKSATDLNPIIKAGTDQLNQLSQAAVDSGAVMSDETVASLDSLGDTIDHVKQSATSAVGTFAAQFAPAIQDVATGLSGLIGGTVSPKEFGASVSSLLNQGLGVILSMLPNFLSVGGQILLALIQGISASLPQLAISAVGILSMLAMSLLGMLPQLLDMGLQVIINLANGIAASLPTLIPAIVACVMQIVQTLADNLPALITAAIQIILALITGLVQAIPQLIAYLPTIITSIVTALIMALPLILDAAIQIILALIQGLVSAIPQLVEMLPEIIVSIVNGLIANLPTIISAAPKIILALITGLVSAIPQLVAAIPRITTAITDAFQKINWGDIGKNILTGIKDGILGAVSGLVSAAKEAANKAVQGVKDFLGIKSPSTVMRDQVGMQMMAGAEQGVEKKTGSLLSTTKAAMQKAVHGAASAFDIPVDIQSQYAFSMSAGTRLGYSSGTQTDSSTNITYNITVPGGIPTSDTEKKKLAQMIEQVRREAILSKGVALA